MLQGSSETLTKARVLRQSMSLPEVLLWRILRTRPNGLKFRRQHPAGEYIADFYCHEARLIIEIDGEAHNRGARPQRDAVRDRWFAERSLIVRRFPAAVVLTDPAAVTAAIVAEAERLIPLHHASHGPPPPLGEDLAMGAC